MDKETLKRLVDEKPEMLESLLASIDDVLYYFPEAQNELLQTSSFCMDHTNDVCEIPLHTGKMYAMFDCLLELKKAKAILDDRSGE